MNTISVWLKSKSEGTWLLQKRSEKNRSFPFVCQPTWAGKVEAGEAIEDAVRRECEEELGKDFCANFNFSSLMMVKKTHYARDERMWEVYNFMGLVDDELLEKVVLCDESFPEFIRADASVEISL